MASLDNEKLWHKYVGKNGETIQIATNHHPKKGFDDDEAKQILPQIEEAKFNSAQEFRGYGDFEVSCNIGRIYIRISKLNNIISAEPSPVENGKYSYKACHSSQISHFSG